MASLTMMHASLSAVAADRRGAAPRRGSLAVARAATGGRGGAECQQEVVQAASRRGAEGRRAVMLAAAAAVVALSAVGDAGVAQAEVKRGTPEAKKKYSSICVAMPTAKVCHN
ncbi:hypothetical protein GUJ93_ZPchr0002g24712 [Zizania palustris]|uniref:Photosystem II 5 kDa protein, chloroplastic n=1 Tax=Zizania palustris TaxID=103762 RepID=A0A8J5SPM1_ZIZPA|nr:hypothetical protein GUJ93_ZPchr0002g24712 [Zizania palustris]